MPSIKSSISGLLSGGSANPANHIAIDLGFDPETNRGYLASYKADSLTVPFNLLP